MLSENILQYNQCNRLQLHFSYKNFGSRLIVKKQGYHFRLKNSIHGSVFHINVTTGIISRL